MTNEEKIEQAAQIMYYRDLARTAAPILGQWEMPTRSEVSQAWADWEGGPESITKAWEEPLIKFIERRNAALLKPVLSRREKIIIALNTYGTHEQMADAILALDGEK
jgi:hypothetical protein